MSDSNEGDRTETRLRRLEELVGDLGRITDPVARAHVRELFEMLLDSHGVAIARLTARLARTPEGMSALAELGADQQVRPILLLHGLHPDDLETRLRQAVAGLRNEGIGLMLGRISNRAATVRLDDEATREQVEAALFEAAPDLEGIIFDGDDRAALKADLTATQAA